MRLLTTSLLFALAAGCLVPKKQLDAALAENVALTEQIGGLQADLMALRALADQLEAALDESRGREEELGRMATDLEGQNAKLGEQLGALEDKLAAFTRASAEERAEWESMLDEIRAGAKDAEAQAQAARARIEELAAEAERLRAEKEKLQARTQAYDDLVASLEDEIAAGEVTITELSGKLTVNLSNAILFDLGSYRLRQAGQDALAKVAGVLAEIIDREVRVEGHTDDLPVKAGAPFADNWALSALRASTVVSALVADGVDPLNIAVVGFGEHHPLQPNDSDEGRAANRRTEIVLVPRLKPQATGAPPTGE